MQSCDYSNPWFIPLEYSFVIVPIFQPLSLGHAPEPFSPPDYSQCEGGEDLFERERDGDPDLSLWDDSARACQSVY